MYGFSLYIGVYPHIYTISVSFFSLFIFLILIIYSSYCSLNILIADNKDRINMIVITAYEFFTL